MNPRSNNLFHFTKQKETIQLILKNGFWPRYCMEDTGWHGIPEYPFVAFPMTCFCDIPISRISEHVHFYGKYGIGLDKSWAIRNNVTPVMYYPEGNSIAKAAMTLFQHIIDNQKEESDLIEDMRHILAHSKPIFGKMLINNELIEKDFYQESEWRYVPRGKNLPSHLTEEYFNNIETLNAKNEVTRIDYMLKFTPEDIRYIFVPSDSEIPDMITFIQSSMDDFNARSQKILMSRVTSLECLAQDI